MSVSAMIDRAGTVADIQTLDDTVRGTSGGVKEAYATRLPAEPLRIRARSGREEKQLGTERVISTHRAYFKIKDLKGNKMVINAKDRIIVKDKKGVAIGTFDAQFVDNPNQLNKYIQVDLVQRV